MAFLCQACAVSYTDSSGDRHVVGLVNISVHPPSDKRTFAGDVFDLTSVGVAFSQNAQGGFVALGYNREVTAELRNDVLISGDPLHPAQPLQKEGNPQ